MFAESQESVLYRYDVPAYKGRLEEPQVLDELVHLVGECQHFSTPTAHLQQQLLEVNVCRHSAHVGAHLAKACVASAECVNALADAVCYTAHKSSPYCKGQSMLVCSARHCSFLGDKDLLRQGAVEC